MVFEAVVFDPVMIIIAVLFLAILFAMIVSLNIFGIRDWLVSYLNLFRV